MPIFFQKHSHFEKRPNLVKILETNEAAWQWKAEKRASSS